MLSSTKQCYYSFTILDCLLFYIYTCIKSHFVLLYIYLLKFLKYISFTLLAALLSN